MSDSGDSPKNPTPLWPKLIILAFIFGGILWVFWMAKFIRQTRANNVQGFFVPINTNPEPIYAHRAETNATMPAGTNLVK